MKTNIKSSITILFASILIIVCILILHSPTIELCKNIEKMEPLRDDSTTGVILLEKIMKDMKERASYIDYKYMLSNNFEDLHDLTTLQVYYNEIYGANASFSDNDINPYELLGNVVMTKSSPKASQEAYNEFFIEMIAVENNISIDLVRYAYNVWYKFPEKIKRHYDFYNNGINMTMFSCFILSLIGEITFSDNGSLYTYEFNKILHDPMYGKNASDYEREMAYRAIAHNWDSFSDYLIPDGPLSDDIDKILRAVIKDNYKKMSVELRNGINDPLSYLLYEYISYGIFLPNGYYPEVQLPLIAFNLDMDIDMVIDEYFKHINFSGNGTFFLPDIYDIYYDYLIPMYYDIDSK